MTSIVKRRENALAHNQAHLGLLDKGGAVKELVVYRANDNYTAIFTLKVFQAAWRDPEPEVTPSLCMSYM